MTEQVSTPGAVENPTRFERVLGAVPMFLASHIHVVLLMGLGFYLIALPLLGVNVSSKSELIGGNYTNVTSDIGACIAAGGTIHLVKKQRKRNEVAEATHKIMADLYRHHAGAPHPAAIAEITGHQE